MFNKEKGINLTRGAKLTTVSIYALGGHLKRAHKANPVDFKSKVVDLTTTFHAQAKLQE